MLIIARRRTLQNSLQNSGSRLMQRCPQIHLDGFQIHSARLLAFSKDSG